MKPIPKSSSDIPQPSDFNSFMNFSAAPRSGIDEVSVISKTRSDGSAPVSFIFVLRKASRSMSPSSLPERFRQNDSGLPFERFSAWSIIAFSKMTFEIELTSPNLSAMSMNGPGSIILPSLSRILASTSKVPIVPSPRRSIG